MAIDAIIAAVMKALEGVVKYAPGLITEIKKLFSGPPPTEADWQAFHARVEAKSYKDYDPNFDADQAAATGPAARKT